MLPSWPQHHMASSTTGSRLLWSEPWKVCGTLSFGLQSSGSCLPVDESQRGLMKQNKTIKDHFVFLLKLWLISNFPVSTAKLHSLKDCKLGKCCLQGLHCKLSLLVHSVMLWHPRLTEQAALRNLWLNTKEYEKSYNELVICVAGKASMMTVFISPRT